VTEKGEGTTVSLVDEPGNPNESFDKVLNAFPNAVKLCLSFYHDIFLLLYAEDDDDDDKIGPDEVL
jgi:hypothetical protein